MSKICLSREEKTVLLTLLTVIMILVSCNNSTVLSGMIIIRLKKFLSYQSNQNHLSIQKHRSSQSIPNLQKNQKLSALVHQRLGLVAL